MLKLSTQACSETSYAKYFTTIHCLPDKFASEHFTFLNFVVLNSKYIRFDIVLKLSSMCKLFFVIRK